MEEKKDTNVKATIDAVTGLAKAVPVYQDAVQPAAKEIGKSLATVTKTVNIALAPIKALVWGYEKIEDYLTKRVSEKLSDIAEQDIKTPPTNIAGPAVEALKYTGHNENLRELYASLLAMSMNKNTSDKAHPSFVEVIKNLSTSEALILQQFIGKDIFPKVDIQETVEDGKGDINRFINFTLFHRVDTRINVNNIPTFIDNLQRLGVVEVLRDEYLSDEKKYEALKNDSSITSLVQSIESRGNIVNFRKGVIRLTSFGKDFVKSVVAMK